MALTITKKDTIFEVKGKINAATASYFKTHFAITLNALNELSIDINAVTEIDANGVQALKTIHEKAQSWKKPLYIIGLGSKEIYDEFKSTNLA